MRQEKLLQETESPGPSWRRDRETWSFCGDARIKPFNSTQGTPFLVFLLKAEWLSGIAALQLDRPARVSNPALEVKATTTRLWLPLPDSPAGMYLQQGYIPSCKCFGAAHGLASPKTSLKEGTDLATKSLWNLQEFHPLETFPLCQTLLTRARGFRCCQQRGGACTGSEMQSHISMEPA